MSSQTMRTYQLPHRANKDKLTRIAAVLPEYQATMRRMQGWQMRRFYNGEGFWDRADCKAIPSLLSARYKYSCRSQVVAGLRSWQELCKEQFRHHVTESSLDEQTKIQLYRVNARAAWYQKSVELPELDEQGHKTENMIIVPAATMALARHIMKHIRRHRNHLPNLSRSKTMSLDGTVAQVEQSKTGSFDYWVRVSTLNKGKPCWVPLKGHRFFTEAPGEVRNHCQVRVENGTVSFSLLKSFDMAPNRTDGVEIGLDYGLRSLFASTAGDLLGRSLYPWLQGVDQQLTQLTANLRRQGIKPKSSKRYRKFQSRIRAYVENEINRCLNRVVEIHQPRSIAVENLDFRHGGLSSRLNRILSRAGRHAVKAKLQALHETKGVAIILVNPAYTSQQCADCDYVAKSNRNGDKFVCGFCNHHSNADVNGARTVLGRSQEDMTWLYIGKHEVLRRLEDRFRSRWGIDFATVQQRIAARQSDLLTPKRRRASGSLPAGQPVGIAANLTHGMNFYGN
jgi:putative transposase